MRRLDVVGAEASQLGAKIVNTDQKYVRFFLGDGDAEQGREGSKDGFHVNDFGMFAILDFGGTQWERRLGQWKVKGYIELQAKASCDGGKLQ